MTNQKDLAEMLQQALRLSTLSEKAEDQLNTAIQKWFDALFVRSMKLSLAKEIYSAGAFDAFRQIIQRGSDGQRTSILMKLDKHNLEVFKLSRDAVLVHLEGLASGKIKPAPQKRQAMGKSSARGGKRTAEEKTIIQSSKY